MRNVPVPQQLLDFSLTPWMQEKLSAHLHLCGSVIKAFCEGKRKKILEELSQEDIITFLVSGCISVNFLSNSW